MSDRILGDTLGDILERMLGDILENMLEEDIIERMVNKIRKKYFKNNGK